MGREVARKAAVLRETSRPYWKKVLGNAELGVAVRMRIVHSIMFSRSASHAGTWPELGHSEFLRFKAPVMRIFRVVAGAVVRKIDVAVVSPVREKEVVSAECTHSAT